MGNVGADPEVKDSVNGIRYARFSLATSDKWKDGEKTNWHRCICFGKMVEVVEQWVHKGNKLYVEGRMEYEDYEKDGVKMRNATVHVRELVMLGSKNDSTGSTGAVERPKPGLVESDDDDLPF
jgi:single-strand DNA-binding protein